MQGKALIVTGSTGIAAAAVRLAAEAGAHLVIAAADPESGWELAAATGAECWVGDLALANSADSVIGVCLARFGRVDALFNAAGLSGRRFGDGPVHECSDEGWDVTMQHNLRTTFQMCRAAIGRMLQQAPEPDGIRGAILNMGGVLAEAPEPRHFATHAYAAAKGAVVALSRSMAAFYAPHRIRVNVISPAVVRTPASERSLAGAELREFLGKKQPLAGGMVEAEDVARAALFLLGPDSRSITGDVLTVDAGWSVTGV
jgi:NAD(P)-dependent dehydrogenase (short-subunit alcohol dehydrogenase family)